MRPSCRRSRGSPSSENCPCRSPLSCPFRQAVLVSPVKDRAPFPGHDLNGMNRFSKDSVETESERCRRLARYWTWASIASASIGVDVGWFGNSVVGAVVIVALAFVLVRAAEKQDDRD